MNVKEIKEYLDKYPDDYKVSVEVYDDQDKCWYFQPFSFDGELNAVICNEYVPYDAAFPVEYDEEEHYGCDNFPHCDDLGCGNGEGVGHKG